MNLHEYQAKTLLKNNNVRVLAGIPVLEVTDIDNAIDSIQTPVMVVKSQIHAGGRGAGKFLDSGDDKGGVRVCFSKEEAKENAKKIIADVKKLKLKIQIKIQGEELRAEGKKRDDLQEAISAMEAIDIGLPIEFVNFRD